MRRRETDHRVNGFIHLGKFPHKLCSPIPSH